jgi:hypothetical protein
LVIGKEIFSFEYLTLGEVLFARGLQIAFAGLPFFVLAAKSDRRRAMWIVAFVLTCGSWTYYVWQTWRDSLTGFAGGANIGAGMIMMAAPLGILLILKGVSWALRSRAAP